MKRVGRKGRKGGRLYVCPDNGYMCWAYTVGEAKSLLKTDNVVLWTAYRRNQQKTITGI